ncbi:transglycosylase SLT domain-containing protein, partial [candidate division GN15 bacterium]|nr:transglycosylase SLT domain-containing protein [candidate division GN15 bacterium]
KATKEFESFFMYQMLKTMRRTIPDNPLTKDAPMSGGMGKDMFTDMFDMEIAKQGDFGGHRSISGMLYDSLEKLIDAKFGDEETVPDKPFRPVEPGRREPIELNPDRPMQPLPEAEELTPLPANDRTPLPAQTVPRKVTQAPENPHHAARDPILRRYGALIDEAARETKLDSTLIASVIRAESGGDPKAVSHAGAKGLMQLIDTTAQDLKVRDVYDPKENIRAGSRYLRQMLDRFGSVDLALAAYNAGPGNVEEYGGIPPFDETKDYVKRVTQWLAGAKAEEAVTSHAEPAENKGRATSKAATE